MTTLYKISWHIDVEADSPREAAEKARAIQQNPDSTATVFDVYPQDRGGKHTIDLARS